MQEISLFDDVEIRLSKAEKNKISVEGDFDCRPEKNLCYRAAEEFFREFSVSGVNIKISVDKRIPTGAGLGGGSSDGAAVIRLLAEQFHITDEKRLCSVCLRLGADVPFFLQGKTRLAEGIGERLSSVKRNFSAFVLLAKPDKSVLSGDIYRLFDAVENPSERTTDAFLSANQKGENPFGYVFNALEQATATLCSEVKEIKDSLLLHCADAAAMSGSGTSVFGLFSDREKAEAALKEIKKKQIFCGIYEFI